MKSTLSSRACVSSDDGGSTMLSRVPERKREVVEVATNRGETMQPRIIADFSKHSSETRPRLSMAERLENFSEVGTNADPCMQESCELRLLKTVNHRLICLVLPRPPSQRTKRNVLL